MTAEAITQWLQAPAEVSLPEDLDKSIKEWPWFAPLRLMKAYQQDVLATPETANSTLRLYVDHWLPAYQLLQAETLELPEQGLEENIEPEEVESEASLAPTTQPDEAMQELEEVPEQADAEPISTPEIPEPEAPHTVAAEHKEEPLIQPAFTEEYFRYEGLEVSDALPEPEEDKGPQTLMVMRSFSEWLNYFKMKAHHEEQEAREKSALRSMWQQERLASALDEQPEEIPEQVFEMAVSSLTKEDDLVSESLAQIYERQQKWEAAERMYRKLALKYPSKSAYFAGRAEAVSNQLK